MKIHGYMFAIAGLLLASGALAERATQILPDAPAKASLKPLESPAGHNRLGLPDLGDAKLDTAEVRGAIERANAGWMTAFRDGDSKSLASMYASDASLIPPKRGMLEGRASIVEYFAAQQGLGMREPFVKTLEVYTLGNVAYEVGTYGVLFDSGDGDRYTDSGRYFAIWKSQAGEDWLYHHGIWSSTERDD